MFSRELEAAVRLLETSPLIGKSYPQAPVPEVRRLLIGRSRYHIYWEVDAASQAVTIVAVWYAGRGIGPRL
jgi:plasmid stabilization system protein ParE